MDTVDGRFYLVAADEVQDSIVRRGAGDIVGKQGSVLARPPRWIHDEMRGAEAEAVRLARAKGGGFLVLAAIARVEIVDGVPRWVEL